MVIFLDGFDVQAMALAVPALSRVWQLPAASFSVALAGSVLGLGVGAAFIAPLGDRFGRRPVLIACTALLGASALATVAATGVGGLSMLRFLTGIALGACQGNATALMADFARKERRARTLTLMGCNISVGALTAGFAAPWMIGWLGWRGIFVVGGLLPLALCATLLALLPESPEIFNAGTTATVQRVRRFAALRTLLGPDLRAKTLLLWAIYACNTFLNFLVLSWLPTLLANAGWHGGTALRGVMAYHLGGIAGALTLSVVMDRGRPTLALTGGFAMAAMAAALFAVVPPLIPAWSVLIAVLGSGIAGTTFALFALAAAAYPSGVRAAGYGWLAAVARAGAVCGPLVGGALLAFAIPPRFIMAWLALPALICAALSLRVRRTMGSYGNA